MNTGSSLQAPVHAARGRVLGLVAFALILLTATIALPALSGASTYRAGLNVRIDSGDQVEGNVYIVAPEMRFDAQAPQNVTIATITGNIHGSIGGNLQLLAGRTTVRADIDGSVHVAGGDVTLVGDVGGDVVVAGGSVTVDGSSTIGGDLIVAGGRARLDGTVQGSVYGTALTIRHGGTVNGDMQVQTSRLSVTSAAQVQGDLRYQSPIDADIARQTGISGTIERTNATPWAGVGDGALSPFGSLLKLTWSLLTGAAVIAIAPRLLSRIADHAQGVLQPAAIGIVAIVLLPVAALLLLGTIIGIPLGVMLLAMIPIGLYLSQVVAGLTLGRLVMPRSWRDGSRGTMILAMTLGVLVLGILRMLPIPYLGPIVTAIITFWGFGAIIMVVTDLTSNRLRARGA